MSEIKLSPGMEQYKKIKDQYKDCILLYRLGDFYEMFYEDAVIWGEKNYICQGIKLLI